jgi:putative DNA methylase
VSYKKKLIEVALPLPEVNDASAYDKMPGIGPHPKGIHHWWARLPLPTSRAVLFASVVDDPSEHPEKWATEAAQNAERERLFDILRRMMDKKLHERPEVYAEARSEMIKHCDGSLPAVFDPFAGGGSIPLEANRLGFEAHAGDLNPVAVLLNKCNLELAPRWIGHPPVNPEDRKRIGGTQARLGTHGLAADVRYYGRLIRDRGRAKIGRLYPKVRLPKEHGGGEANVIAWIWSRTVASPNPAARGKHVPLISTYWLCGKKGSEAWLEPVVDKAKGTWRFEVRTGTPKERSAGRAGTKNGSGGFRCLLTDAPIPFDYIRSEGAAGRLGFVMLAVVAERPRARIYLPASASQVEAAGQAAPSGFPDTDLPEEALGFRVQNYGIRKHWQMFTPRQLTAMATLSDLVKMVGADVRREAAAAGLRADEADSYARTVTTFLALSLDRSAAYNNAFARWNGNQTVSVFTRQAIPMVWDFVEANILGEKAVCWHTAVDICADAIETISPNPALAADARQIDAARDANGLHSLLVSTDPPYYDNIGYAALSDFFYVWLRRTIGNLYPDLFSTVLVPKMPELTASPERFDGDKERAREHFETGFRKAFAALRDKMDPRFPLTVYYAFKQTDEESGADEEEGEGIVGVDLTTGWETLLEALISSGFQITATWPVQASFKWRVRAQGSNALASYIVLACRPRPAHAPETDRRSFVAELKRDLPSALRHLQQGNVAPVDFAQAAIGPGMAIYSRYSCILESSGKAMTVRTALSLTNQTLAEVLSEQEEDFDADTRWAIAWFEQHGMNEGLFGDADVLARAKNTSVQGLVDAGVLSARAGKVRLLKRTEYEKDWDPARDGRVTVWECTQHLILQLDTKGEEGAALLCGRLGGGRSEDARALAYRLYAMCERKGWAEEALAYNSLVVSWPAIQERAARLATTGRQTELFQQKSEERS